ncbi:4Fe-4S binding protein [soil metagenome]
MPLDPAALRACAGKLESATQLCRGEAARARAAFAAGGPVTIGCTQEEPFFEDLAAEEGHGAPRAYANIRENGFWSQEAGAAGPKSAALLAAAAAPMPPIRLFAMESKGVVLVLGRNEAAIEAGLTLAEHLDVTVLLVPGAEVAPPRQTLFPVLQGRVKSASGHLGAFELTIDAFAHPYPSSRTRLAFGPATDGAGSQADLVLDLRGEAPLLAGDALRSGYLRADPRDPAAIARAVLAASHLVGTFDKPRFIEFDATLCAHSRNRLIGCTRCLDLCPAGAITPAGDSVAIDPAICAGCGQCASVCPTGAASYALPPVDALAGRLRTLLQTYAKAGGSDAVLLLHDAAHGAPLIEAAARFGAGLPARVLPVAVNEITQIGPETLAGAIAYGAAGIRVLAPSRPRHDLTALARALKLTETVLGALGYGEDALRLIETDDPDALTAALASLPRNPRGRTVSGFLPSASKRGQLENAFRELHRTAPAPVDSIALPDGAPFGAALVDTEACSLCLACVSACPTGALSDNPEQPMLRFSESLCVQCGLCDNTCPEDAITLLPRLEIPAWDNPRQVVKEEEPFHCIECGKAFGTRSSIERVRERLAEHWMYSGAGEARRRVLEMCEDCRVAAVVNESFDPHDLATRQVRTTDDYLRARKLGRPNGD